MQGNCYMQNNKTDYSYIEKTLPNFLKEDIEQIKKGHKLLVDGENGGKKYYQYDLDIEGLNSSINIAEVEDIITKEQANFLRRKYIMQEFEWN